MAASPSCFSAATIQRSLPVSVKLAGAGGVPPTGATKGTNLNLAGVNPALYAGGFQDFDPGLGVDIAQDMVVGGDPTTPDETGEATFDLQWDDPVDPSGAPLGPPLLQITGHTDAG